MAELIRHPWPQKKPQKSGYKIGWFSVGSTIYWAKVYFKYPDTWDHEWGPPFAWAEMPVMEGE
jgi:hypothetical protein